MQPYVYDSRNRLLSTGGVSYGYNAENMRTSVTTDGNTIRYVINPNAALSQVLMETDADGNPLAYYVYGLGLLGREDASGTYQSYHYDRRGSKVALTALDGTITDTYQYGPYGEQIGHEGATEQPFRYNGRDGVMTDVNGLYHMRARYYSPDIKLFINRDVVTGTISDTPTLNRYAYVNGNPISYIDPFGLSRDGDSLMLRGGDVLLDLLPGIGALKGFQQAFTGVNLVTGEKLSVGQRWMEGIGSTIGLIPIPCSKAIGKYGVEGAVALGKKAKGWFGKTPDKGLALYRRTANVGEFNHLKVPMQMREVKRLAEQAGVGLDGVKIKIVRDTEMLRLPQAGWANPNGKEIQLYPNAFINEMELVKTLAHERTHIFQVRIYGEANDIPTLNKFEEGAYGIEDTFWDYFNRRGK
ncbi:RHS repeat-associated core domain-containing protein [Paenibacillus sp. FSL K6-1230]|uniref:RHS repeat-associated core domain-containing protein n=1 Tax=Paenibacillus sp. FSL K6-1230 TaxID=2921603 RepID=UPI0030F5BFC9